MKGLKNLKIMLLISIVCLVFSETAFATLSYSIADMSPDWEGGPFYVNVYDNNTLLTGFVSYCLEKNEYLDFSTKFLGTIDDYAIQGGSGFSNKGGTETAPTIPGKDYLNPWTEWLVANYLSHSLVTDQRRKDFQNAIWYIEGEIDSYTPGEFDYYTAVKNADPGDDIPWIRVLNLYSYTRDGRKIDNQSLIYVPEPGVLILLGIGLTAVGLAGRRFRKTS